MHLDVVDQMFKYMGNYFLLGALITITPVRFGVGGADKGATECGGSMSNQLTVLSRGAFVMVCKG